MNVSKPPVLNPPQITSFNQEDNKFQEGIIASQVQLASKKKIRTQRCGKALNIESVLPIHSGDLLSEQTVLSPNLRIPAGANFEAKKKISFNSPHNLEGQFRPFVFGSKRR